MIHRVTWAQVGRLTEPGRFMFKFGWVTITPQDLWVWENFPSAAFTLVQTLPRDDDGAREFRLGTFDLRAALNYAEGES